MSLNPRFISEGTGKMVDINKVADVVCSTDESAGDENCTSRKESEVSWDNYIAFLENKVQKAAVHDEYEAYHLYCEYAHAMGFSVRKGKHDYFSGTTKMRSKLFTCSKEGSKDSGIDKKGKISCTKSNERTGCLARIWFTRSMDGLFKVTKWIKEHNHGMAELNQRHLLRSARSTGLFKGNLIDSYVNVGVPSIDSLNMVVEDSVKHAGDSQSQFSYDTESEFMYCNRLMRMAHELVMQSKVHAEARKIVEKAMEGASENLQVFFQKQNVCVEPSKEAVNVIEDKDDENDLRGVDAPFVKPKGVSRARVRSHCERERQRKRLQKAIQRASNRKRMRKALASQDTNVQHISSSIP